MKYLTFLGRIWTLSIGLIFAAILGVAMAGCASFGSADSDGQKLYRLNAVTTYTMLLARDYVSSPQANPSIVATVVASAAATHAGLLESDAAYDEGGGGKVTYALALASGALETAEDVVNIALDIDLGGGNVLAKATKLGSTWAGTLAEMRALRKDVARPVLDSLGEGEDPDSIQWEEMRAIRDAVFAAIAAPT